MNQLQIFSNSEFGNLNVLLIDGKEHFPATECARALGYKDAVNAIKQHCRWVVKRHLPHPQSASKQIQMNFIPEGDLHRLITNSRLPNAKKYESWVFDEVIPTIRKTGAYFQKNQNLPKEANTQPPPPPEPKQIEEPYEYKPKHWRGRQVVTLKDIEKLTGVEQGALASALGRHRKEIRVSDGCLLGNEELRQFKKEHGLCWNISTLWVLTRKGVEKLSGWMRQDPTGIAVWTGRAPAAKAQPPVPIKQMPVIQNLTGPEWVDVPGSPEAQKVIAELRKGMAAMEAAISMYNRCHLKKGQGYQNQLIILREVGDYIAEWAMRADMVHPPTKTSM